MKPIVLIFLGLVGLLLKACTEATTYPGTGAECEPGDPVQGLTVPECPPVM
jgi:hypothetical protein